MGCKVSAGQAFGFDSLKRLHILEDIDRRKHLAPNARGGFESRAVSSKM
uniref:Uncharacterized protein n=2 Tax=unclassified Kuttervirus TaxID=2770329 RepID=A0AAU8GIR9_9CAUD